MAFTPSPSLRSLGALGLPHTPNLIPRIEWAGIKQMPTRPLARAPPAHRQRPLAPSLRRGIEVCDAEGPGTTPKCASPGLRTQRGSAGHSRAAWAGTTAEVPSAWLPDPAAQMTYLFALVVEQLLCACTAGLCGRPAHFLSWVGENEALQPAMVGSERSEGGGVPQLLRHLERLQGPSCQSEEATMQALPLPCTRSLQSRPLQKGPSHFGSVPDWQAMFGCCRTGAYVVA